ncbi:MAG: nickel pincer cofactor biosynthesis protein LarC [Chloroflexota bacterium]
MRVAYFDCATGASGDMILGALVDAGVAPDALRAALSSLPLRGWQLDVQRVQRTGLAATHVRVLHEDAQPQRRLPDILDILSRSGLPDVDRERAARVFRALAEAEARVHGISPEAVHFHEVGAVDAIVDVTGTAVALRLLGIEQVYVSPLPLGSGTVRTAHGLLPVPAPATLELLTAARAPIRASADEPPAELITPTGAALLTTLGRFERPAMRLTGSGTGAGGRDLPDRPNVLRVLVGETEAAINTRSMVVLETNIDDMPAELFGHALDQLFAAGAADVWFTPIQMKKNRPATMLSVLCRPEQESIMVDLLLRETSTLGVRARDVRRYETERERFEFASSLGSAAVKVKRLAGEPPRVAPEYEVCRALATRTGLPLLEVYRIVTTEAEAALRDSAQEISET